MNQNLTPHVTSNLSSSFPATLSPDPLHVPKLEFLKFNDFFASNLDNHNHEHNMIPEIDFEKPSSGDHYFSLLHLHLQKNYENQMDDKNIDSNMKL